MPARRTPTAVVSPASTPAEAAAIAAAIEQFAFDTAPPPTAPERRSSPWQRAALLEGTGREPDAPSPWGDPVPWG
jgi:hypothetical protein